MSCLPAFSALWTVNLWFFFYCLLCTLAARSVTCCRLFYIFVLKWSFTSLSHQKESTLDFSFIPPMQAQQIRSATQSITHTQSLAVVKTLLQAGLGAITYLRFFHLSFSCYVNQLILFSKKFTTRGQFFFTSIFLSHMSQLITDHELDHLNTVTSEDALLTKNSDNSLSQEASQSSIDSRKHANRFRIMVSFSLSFNCLNS